MAAFTAFVVPTCALIWLLSQVDIQSTLKEYQGLAGGLTAMFAASLATFGLVLNVISQQKNTNTNVREQREIEIQRRGFDVTQLASALLGEVTSILHLIDRRNILKIHEDNVRAWEHGLISINNEIESDSIGIAGDYTNIFRGNVGKIGILPGDLPRLLSEFYGHFTSASVLINVWNEAETDYDDVKYAIETNTVIASELRHVINLGSELISTLNGVIISRIELEK